MTTTKVHTYCRICEPYCGMEATVEDGELTALRPYADHPLSKGFACPKGIAMKGIVNDPDRVLYPLRRKVGTPPGPASIDDFERVSWDEALDGIGARLNRVIGEHGGSSVGCYLGNPAYFSYSGPMYAGGFMDALGTKHYYTPNSQDTASRFAATGFMFGSILSLTIPDIYRTKMLLMVGANPLTSHGSLVAGKELTKALRAIPKRGGRVVVVDPRRTRTAEAFEHVPVRPDTDAWMLLAMLHVIFEEGLEDREALDRQASGVDGLRAMAEPHTPESTEGRTGIPAATLRQLARDLATAESAAVYGRCGTNRGRHATLVAFLLDCLNVVTGNLDREGGALFGMFATPAAANKRIDSYGTKRTRVGNFPDAFGMGASPVMAKEMLQPGDGQLRAFFAIGGNPILSCPDGDELGEAMKTLDLTVAIELYVSETAQYADYILPATTFYEREDVNLITAHFNLSPHLEWTEPVIAPRGEARQEWEIIDAIARRVGIVPSSEPVMRFLGRLGFRPSPKKQIDAALRLGQFGDLFGLRRKGLNLAKLAKMPGGIVVRDHVKTGVLKKKVRHADGRAHLSPPPIVDEFRQLGDRHREDPAFPLSLIGMRELRSHNSWMHNVPKLMAGGHGIKARIHPGDAEDAGIADGDLVRITSSTGAIELPALLTDEVIRGTVAVPHGWGHRPGSGWSVANARPGVNVNLLASTELEDIEPLSGMTLLDGIAIRIEAATTPRAPQGLSVAEHVAPGERTFARAEEDTRGPVV